MTTQTPETRAARFRRRVLAAYDEESMSPADLEYVEEVAYVMNLLDRLRAEITEGDLTETRQGGSRMRPVVVEARLQAQHLSALLARFPHLEEEE
jgi:hypothetical protein